MSKRLSFHVEARPRTERRRRTAEQNLKNCSTLRSRPLSIFQAKLTMIISHCENRQFAICFSLLRHFSLVPSTFPTLLHPVFLSCSLFLLGFLPVHPVSRCTRGFLSSGRLKTALKANSSFVSRRNGGYFKPLPVAPRGKGYFQRRTRNPIHTSSGQSCPCSYN